MTPETDENRKRKDNGDSSRSKRTGILEKIFTFLSLVAIVLMAGYLIKESGGSPPPASFEVETAAPQLRGDFTAVEVFVTNTGEQAAKAVNLRGEIAAHSEKPIEAEATLDWLPGNSRRKVTLIFPGDQTTTTPEVQVLGYEEP